MDIGRPAWLLIQESQKELTFPLKGPEMLRSSGCSLCEQWGGKDSMMIPFARQKSISFYRKMGGMVIKYQEEFGVHWGHCVALKVFGELNKMILQHPSWWIRRSNASRWAIPDEMVLEVNTQEYEHGWNHVPQCFGCTCNSYKCLSLSRGCCVCHHVWQQYVLDLGQLRPQFHPYSIHLWLQIFIYLFIYCVG